MDALCCRYFNITYIMVVVGTLIAVMVDAWILGFSISTRLLHGTPFYESSWTEGLTRAVKALLQGSIQESLAFHPLGLGIVIFFAIQLILRSYFINSPSKVMVDLVQQSSMFIAMVLGASLW